ncbi:MAG TPA: cupin domain-containing protein [Candidatus Acidoferrales bacterium]|nr:cupin domain-containing protein [Candidatus Acidoferrales bacterium]
MHTEEQYRDQLTKEGFTRIYAWEDPGEHFYPDHTHGTVTSHIVLDGEMTVVMGGEQHKYFPGDRCDVPAGTLHSALAGPHGCRYLIGEK